jgi:hypothetical protein
VTLPEPKTVTKHVSDDCRAWAAWHDPIPMMLAYLKKNRFTSEMRTAEMRPTTARKVDDGTVGSSVLANTERTSGNVLHVPDQVCQDFLLSNSARGNRKIIIDLSTTQMICAMVLKLGGPLLFLYQAIVPVDASEREGGDQTR